MRRNLTTTLHTHPHMCIIIIIIIITFTNSATELVGLLLLLQKEILLPTLKINYNESTNRFSLESLDGRVDRNKHFSVAFFSNSDRCL